MIVEATSTNEESTATPDVLTTLDDGRIVNEATGEVVGMAIPEELLTDGQERMTDGLAHWIMSKILRHDSRKIAAEQALTAAEWRIQELQRIALERLEATPEMIEQRAIVRNSEKIKSGADGALGFFRTRYERALGAWAAVQIGTSQGRTWTTPFGSISLKTTPAKLEVADPSKVIAWAEAFHPAAVKQEKSFLISKIPAAEKKALLSDPDQASAAGLVIVPESEKVTVASNAS